MKEVGKYHIKRVLTLVVALLFGVSAMGATRSVGLRGGESYADHISFMTDNEEVDMIVKLHFDEEANRVTVSALSYFNLLGFEQDVRYGAVMRWRKFHYDRMPYVVESDPAAKYKTTRELRKSMKPRRRHSIFRSWIEAKGATFEMGKYDVVNDYLERCYSVGEDATKVEISLNDMLVMNSPKEGAKRRVKYEIFAKQDLNVDYKIELQRNPCLGEEENLKMATTMLQRVRQCYERLSRMGGADLDNRSRDSLNIFNSFKSEMVAQFPKSDQRSGCPDVAQNIDLYNKYADSLAMVVGHYIAPEIDPAEIYDAAKMIDRYNTRWSLTSDEVERYDIEAACGELIRTIEAKIATQDRPSERLSHAMELFWSAEANFYFITGAK